MNEQTRIQIETALLGYTRFLLYSAESFPVVCSRQLLGGADQCPHSPPEDHLKTLLNVTKSMIDQDSKNIAEGIYPRSLLWPESPGKHLLRYFKILKDNHDSIRRRLIKSHKEFSANASAFLDDLPGYYTRNFHNQTDGYLSEESAELYRHQTEILFKGSLHLMRRLLLAPLLKEIQSRKGTVKILEFGSGTGETTDIILRSCLNVSIHCIDLSEPYLNFSKAKLKDFRNVSFEAQAAESFKSTYKYDIILSSFLFHEIPHKVRREIIDNLKPQLIDGGLFVTIDSLQLDDRKGFNWALKQFPRDFHEPFYTNYTQDDLSQLFAQSFKDIQVNQAFLAKAVLAGGQR